MGVEDKREKGEQRKKSQSTSKPARWQREGIKQQQNKPKHLN